jgi:hypothetical protein
MAELVRYDYSYFDRLNQELIRINEKSHIEEDLISSLLDLLRKHDISSYNHTQIVATIALDLALESGISVKMCEAIYKGSLLHDIGKLFVPSDILSRKTNNLTLKQKELLVSHGRMGEEIIRSFISQDGTMKLNETYATIANQHNIGIGSVIPTSEVLKNRNEHVPFVSIADFVTSNLDEGRLYLKTLTHSETVDSINRKFGRGYFPVSLQDPFNRLMGRYGSLSFNTAQGSENRAKK